MPLEQMDFPASYEALRPVVEHEYFDHRAVPQLEEYLDEQVGFTRACTALPLMGVLQSVMRHTVSTLVF